MNDAEVVRIASLRGEHAGCRALGAAMIVAALVKSLLPIFTTTRHPAVDAPNVTANASA